jgi:hypothetical protein
LLQRLAGRAVLGQVVDLVLQLGNLSPEAAIFLNQFDVRFAAGSHRTELHAEYEKKSGLNSDYIL